jgi:hypothetical protein
MQPAIMAPSLALAVTISTSVRAQTIAASEHAANPPQTRFATTTVMGDTGFWFVPTAEIQTAQQWSVSVYRVNVDYEQGFTDVSSFPITFGIATANNRLELFSAFTVVRRIDRDVRPIFFPPAAESIRAGGVLNEYPLVARPWTARRGADLWIGAKANIASGLRHAPAAIALRGMLKIASNDEVGTGRPDLAMDGILSKEVDKRLELTGFGGYVFRGDPDGYDLLNGFRWGFGAGFPTRRKLRLTTELHGEVYSGDAVRVRRPANLEGASEQDSPVYASVGLTWTGRNGFFAGAGFNWNLRLGSRSSFGAFSDETGDAVGLQVRIGYHPGIRVYVAPWELDPKVRAGQPRLRHIMPREHD